MKNGSTNSIAKKIRSGFLSLILLMLVISAGIIVVSLYYKQQYDEIITSVTKANQIQQLVAVDVKSCEKLYIGDKIEYDRAEFKRKMDENFAYLERTSLKDEDYINTKLEGIRSLYATYRENTDFVDTLTKDQTRGDRYEKMEYARKVRTFIETETLELITKQLEIGQTLKDRINMQYTILIVVCACLAFILIISYLFYALKISGKIAGGLKILATASKTIGDGDLSGKDIVIDTDDELMVFADTFNKMKNNLKKMIIRMFEISYTVSNESKKLNENIRSITESCGQVATAIHDVAAGAENQVHDLVKLSQSVESVHNLGNSVKQALKDLDKDDGDFDSKLARIDKDMSTLIESIYGLNGIGKQLTSLSERYGANCEEVSVSTDEQTGIMGQMLESSIKLRTNIQELEEVVKDFKIVE